MPNKHKKAGFTLSETIITLSLTILIVLLVYSIYLLHARSYREGSIRLELVQNGRVILDRLSRELRQTGEIVTNLPETPDSLPQEIEFQNGHITFIQETNFAQTGQVDSLTLSSDASLSDDFYNEAFIKIIGGVGAGQIRKIIDYSGSTKVAKIENDWDSVPDSNSQYKIDTQYYYIRYSLDNTGVGRQEKVYYFPQEPNTFVSWSAEDPEGNPPLSLVLEDKIIGEYVSSLRLWQDKAVNIEINLEKTGKKVNLFSEVSGRNIE